MIKQINKILLVILFTYLSINTSVNTVGAFLDSDLGLNLYKDLDEGLSDFDEKQYIYELSDQHRNNISANINKILADQGIGECLIDGVSEEIVTSIAEGDIKVLTQNMKKECYNPKNKEFQTKKLGEIVSSLGDIKEYYLNLSKEKSEAIHEISRVGMYSDGYIDNSPFDLIKDIQDINEIIFTEKIEYEGENLDFLKGYKESPFASCNAAAPPPSASPTLNDSPTGDNNSDNNGDDVENNDLAEDDEYIYENNNLSEDNNEVNDNTPDGNDYICDEYINESGLNESSFAVLNDNLSASNLLTDNLGYTFDYGVTGHIALPETNSLFTPTSLGSPTYSASSIAQGISPYESVNDNNMWECNQFFCIVIDFIINEHDFLNYGESKSIENIIETSNKHLKKAANHSLVQSKMTTNNFEISLRDLDLPSMFHMGYIVTTKTPPILNLDNLINNSGQSSQSEGVEDIKHMLIKKYNNFNLDYSDSNNLNGFNKLDSELLNIVKSFENPSKRAENLVSEYSEVQKLRETINSYDETKITNEINNDILGDFENQYNELEQFNKNILNYIDSLDILIKNLNKIKTYSG